jgi:hypothetical protein
VQAEAIGDRADGLAHEKEERVQRKRRGAGIDRKLAGEHLNAAMDHVKAPTHQQQAGELDLPVRAEGDCS